MANNFFIFLISRYQRYISPAFWFLGARCRFYPTCSEYAIQAFEVLPWWKAFIVSAGRILRCGPWNKGGVDKI